MAAMSDRARAIDFRAIRSMGVRGGGAKCRPSTNWSTFSSSWPPPGGARTAQSSPGPTSTCGYAAQRPADRRKMCESKAVSRMGSAYPGRVDPTAESLFLQLLELVAENGRQLVVLV